MQLLGIPFATDVVSYFYAASQPIGNEYMEERDMREGREKMTGAERGCKKDLTEGQ